MTQVITKVAVGDVFYTSWGYDQTNVEFFKVVRSTDKTIWVQETGQVIESSDYGNGDYWKTSSNGEVASREVRDWDAGGYKIEIAPISQHKIKYDGQGIPFFSIKSYKNAWFWDGKPKSASTGH